MRLALLVVVLKVLSGFESRHGDQGVSLCSLLGCVRDSCSFVRDDIWRSVLLPWWVVHMVSQPRSRIAMHASWKRWNCGTWVGMYLLSSRSQNSVFRNDGVNVLFLGHLEETDSLDVFRGHRGKG